MPLREPIADVRSLDLLRSVAAEGSIRQAALRHHVSQPAASTRLRALEDALGLRLLDRSRGRAVLTPEGVAVLQWGEEVLTALDGLAAGVSALRSRRRGPLRLFASLTVAEYFVPTWLQSFRAVAPSTAVSLRMGNSERVVSEVSDGNADVGFVEGSRAPGGLRSRVVADDALAVVVAPAHPWARRRRPITVGELAATSLIVREPGSGTREVLEEVLASHGLALRVLLELPSPTAMKAAAVASGAPAVVSRVAVGADVTAGVLREVVCGDESFERHIRAIWRSDRSLTREANSFLRVVEATKSHDSGGSTRGRRLGEGPDRGRRGGER